MAIEHALVTGGLGFLGSHLVDALLSQGRQVTIVDSLLSNVMTRVDYPACTVIEEPIEDCFPALLPGRGCAFDQIFHLASVVGPAGVLRHTGSIARTVVASGEAVVELALAHRARLLAVSTSEVYGRSGVFGERADCVVPAAFSARLEYAVAKLTAEMAALNRARVTDLHVNVVRPFNIAGPRQSPRGGFVLPRFILAALTGRPLTVFGDGNQVRAFTDVRDIVGGLLMVMDSHRCGRTYNLGNPANELAILDLAQRVIRAVGSESPIIHVDPKEIFGPLYEEGFDKVPDATRARRELQWKPRFSLGDTLRDTIDWYRARPRLVEQVELPGCEPRCRAF